ncbi:uncharacterized protein LOC118647047 isoform X1 [Monomorium pharaonis]|uniref:uncharacterized protein LOC118647047 isoform X1 n=2 Tax=Monomorium pharaonis TaxID=307658 RepID=UPI001746710B|nr:uncharacterized protein LOC118647047 isoform X1 [Monomorium pharaonis]
MNNCELTVVYTCSMCETICRLDEIKDHPCLEGFTRYIIDQNNYFHPQCDDGSIIRKSLIGGQEVFVEEQTEQEEAEQEEAEQEESDQLVDTNVEGDCWNSNRPINLLTRKLHNEEILIEEIRKRPPLWNFKLHISERGARTKKKLWKEIAVSMKGEMTVAQIKKKWKSLSDMFRRHRKGNIQPSGSAAAKKVKWIHYERLSFLHDMQLENVTISNIADLSNSPDVSQNSTETYDHSSSTSQNSRSQSDSGRERSVEPGAIMDRVEELMNESVLVDVTGGLPNDEFTEFGMIVASKLRALSADASELGMIEILKLLREIRKNDQK